jgi:two-component system NtrC family sensor kinase
LGAVVRRYWPWLAAASGLLFIAGVVSFHVTRLNRKLRLALSQYTNELAERKRTEESLRKSEQLRAESEKLAAVGRLAAGVAHEINNPLTGVLTFSHLVREKEDLDEQAKEDLDMIIRETTRVSEIVQGLLEFARERPAVKEPLDVNDVVRLTIQLLGNQEAFHDVIVKGELEEGLPRVDADMNQIQQVLVNLSLNACEAMHDGGTLTIGTSAQDGKVLVAVADTGCGIAREHLDQIFEPFFTTKPVGKGTGLGLSVSYGIMRQHGGTLGVESEVGKGTVFTMVLPSMEH